MPFQWRVMRFHLSRRLRKRLGFDESRARVRHSDELGCVDIRPNDLGCRYLWLEHRVDGRAGEGSRARVARSESPLDQQALQTNRFGLQLQQSRLLLPKGGLLLHQLTYECREVFWAWHPRQARARSAWWSTAVASARRWAPTPDRATMVSTHTFVPVASSWASRPRATRKAPSRNTAGCPRRW
jgi:hypothetical protein